MKITGISKELPLALLKTPDSYSDICIGNTNYSEQVRQMTLRQLSDALISLHAAPCGFQHEFTNVFPKDCPKRAGNLACAHGVAFRGDSVDLGAGHTIRHGIAAADLLGLEPDKCLEGVSFEERSSGRRHVRISAYDALQQLDIHANSQHIALTDAAGPIRRKALLTLQEQQHEPTARLIALRDSIVTLLASCMEDDA